MKFEIDGFVVEIKAKKDYEARNNKEAAKYFMNFISMALADASKYVAGRAYEDVYMNASNAIYETLFKSEFYNR